jgi:hypothetical protein
VAARQSPDHGLGVARAEPATSRSSGAATRGCTRSGLDPERPEVSLVSAVEELGERDVECPAQRRDLADIEPAPPTLGVRDGRGRPAEGVGEVSLTPPASGALGPQVPGKDVSEV